MNNFAYYFIVACGVGVCGVVWFLCALTSLDCVRAIVKKWKRD